MHILIVGYFYLPTGMASSARIRNIAYGFTSAGSDVSIVAMKKNYYEEEELSIIKEMENNGISVDYALDETKTFSKFQKIFLYRICGMTFYKKAKNIHKQNPIDAIFLYGVGYSLHNKLIKYAKQINAITILDIVEHRLGMLKLRNFIENPHTLDVIRGALFTPKSVDVVCVISKKLFEIYKSKKHKYLLPGVEEWKEDAKTECTNNSKGIFNFLYIGILVPRDNPKYLLKLFTEVCRINRDITLTLVGNYMASPQKDYWPNKFKAALGENVVTTGKVTEKQMFESKNEAQAFVLTRANNLPEICSFPTRMLEFLKQQKPTFISDVGDIPRYLDHMIDACILSGELQTDVDNLLKIVNDKSLASKIAMQGYKKGSQHFDRDDHTKNLLEIVKSLN